MCEVGNLASSQSRLSSKNCILRQIPSLLKNSFVILPSCLFCSSTVFLAFYLSLLILLLDFEGKKKEEILKKEKTEWILKNAFILGFSVSQKKPVSLPNCHRNWQEHSKFRCWLTTEELFGWRTSKELPKALKNLEVHYSAFLPLVMKVPQLRRCLIHFQNKLNKNRNS